MARTNYKFEKRRKELERKKKKELKKERKSELNTDPEEAGLDENRDAPEQEKETE